MKDKRKFKHVATSHKEILFMRYCCQLKSQLFNKKDLRD